MRKKVFGRQFKRDKGERKALFSGLISQLIVKGRIETTEAKAKSVKGQIEKLVTAAKKGNKKVLEKNLKPFEAKRMIEVIAPVFKERQGGYTRLIKTGNRFSDNASLAILEWTEKVEYVAPVAKKSDKPKSAKGSIKTSSKTRKEKPSLRKASKGKK